LLGESGHGKFALVLSPIQWAVVLLWTLLGTAAIAEKNNKRPGVPVVKDLGNDLLEVGGIRVNAKLKTAQFPATVNMTSGLLEYFLVGTGGKTHESLLATDIEPTNLHAVMLLLGAKGVSPEKPTAPTGAIISSSLANEPPLKGDPVTISVSWSTGKTQHRLPAEDLIFNLHTHKAMSHGTWVYNGSYMFEGQFVAQEGKSFVALVDDPEALINNPQPGHDDDQIWSPNEKTIMPLNTAVEITVTILSNTTPAAPTP
jgi:hypothetical protein